MQLFTLSRRVALLATIGVASIALTACGGSGNSILAGNSGNGYVRIIDGSPDAGNVDIAVDNNVILSNASYGSVTHYVSVTGASNHVIHVYAAGVDSGNGILSGNISPNAGSDYSVVITGEQHPSYQATANLALTTFQEQPYNIASAAGSVGYHNASPFAAAATGLNAASVQFGYSLNSAPANNAISTAQPFGGQTNPQGLPSNALNTPITLYAVSNATVTTTPGLINGSCANNEIPCVTSSLSLFFVDGPAASTTPATPPASVSVTAKGAFFGAFDANGLLTQ